jgi:hypothetical protein
MIKIITCNELRHFTLAELEALFPDPSDRARARRTRFARAIHRARQPRKSPPRHGGAPRPAAEALSAGA